MRGLLALFAVLAAGLVWASPKPYAGQETRAIASLSAQDVDDLLNGRGWGFAKAAELNGYPGPAHVLELADDLALTAEQRSDVQFIFDKMNARARALGADYVAAEAALDAAFEAGGLEAEQLAILTRQSATLRADLRAAHLEAHLQTAPILTRHQRVLYNQARGYGGGHQSHGGHNHD
ncbi:hypothetical protein [Thalassococcus sp. S3]|uniref:hypothetical protein n=1 Tax=Thalassococcus sp. S3 TaxID=2017482 RepID=UPI0010246E95|nr:hypothetical protein [Thalassococcus sp. S3]QBF34060.1 hypothetical protein CFI11_23035 [Thalassococcus sp. S3]